MAMQAKLPGDASKHDTHRPLADFPPTIWGCNLASFSFPEMEFEVYSRQVEELTEKVKGMLIASTVNPIENIELINLLCRLGVSYHFENEIEEQLSHIFDTLSSLLHKNHDCDLFSVSLLFRVLRQHGYKVPCDVFHKFKDNNGGFKKCTINDAKGLLSLYEAAHLRLHGEDILDEALAFTRQKLEAFALPSISPCLAKQIKKALNRPFHYGVPRLEARQYISLYEEDESSNKIVVKFAKLDFNRVQLLHQKELSVLSSWWKDLNLISKLSYARDRIVEIYFWANGMHFEPQHATSRMMVTYYSMMISALDDTYDAYGTSEELQCLTEALERWDMKAIERLPADYLRVLYEAILNLFNETEKEMSKQGRPYCADYTKAAFIELVKAYNVEAQWSNDRYVPSFEEYMQNGTISSSYKVIAAASFIGTEVAEIKEYHWLSTTPKIVRAGMIIGRLYNDIVGHEDEQKRGHCASSVECYMKEKGVSENEAIEEIKKMIDDAWKDMNEGCMRPTTVPWLLLKHYLNLVRVTDVTYERDDAYTNPSSLKDHINLLFVEPIAL